jgi:chemotaxis protein MotB
MEQRWLTTFNDLVTLLMVFFVLLFSLSSIDVTRLKEALDSLQSGLGVLLPGSRTEVGLVGAMPEDVSPAVMTESEKQEIDSRVEFEEGLGERKAEMITLLGEISGVEAVATEAGVVVSVSDALLFESGSATISPGAHGLLNGIALALNPFSYPVRAEGHTDDRPISTSRYPSNWELSADRAVKVVKYLHENGRILPWRLSAIGYGESKPKADNSTPAGRALNRRVEIFVNMEEG